jgi:hypothetical protein
MRKGMRSLTNATGNSDYLEVPFGVNDLRLEAYATLVCGLAREALISSCRRRSPTSV